MPNVVVQTIDRLTMNDAAAANTGRQRAASHKSGANNSVTGPTVARMSHRWKTASAQIRANIATATTPSTSSLCDMRSREDEPNYQQWRDCEDPERIRCEPMLPCRQHRGVQAMQQLERCGPADA